MGEYYNVKRLALVLAVQAEIEGMKVKNMSLPGYFKQEHFNDKAEELRSLAYAHNEQL
jgi:hypothetical protein